MSRNLKKTVGLLLAGMLAVTSSGFTALAADDTTTSAAADAAATASPAATAEASSTDAPASATETASDATAAPDATTAPEATAAAEADATEEPTSTVSSYDSDKTYKAALSVCTALGIIEGYDDGSIKPESTVTRAEMATIVLRVLNQSGSTTYANVFNDVTSEHWAANNIQAAVDSGIVDGMGDGTFQPDGNVKFEQVIKMLVCASGYDTDAQAAGGYPNGYLTVGGNSLKLLKGVNGTSGEDMPRGEVIKAVYNEIIAPYRRVTTFENGYPVYSDDKTLGEEIFDLYEEKGVLEATSDQTILPDGVTKDGVITINVDVNGETDYNCDLDVNEYLGMKVKFYYKDVKGDNGTVLAMVDYGTSKTIEIDADDIESMDSQSIVAYTSEKSSSTKTYKVDSATVIYNGTVLTPTDFADLDTDETYDEFITPDEGTVKLTDYDNDGVYDVMFIDKYETGLITSATTEKVSYKYNSETSSSANSKTVVIDLNDPSQTVIVQKSGVTASVKNLKKNDVISIKRNVDDSRIEIYVTGDSVTGQIETIGKDGDYTTVTINGTVYKVAETAINDVNVGDSGVYYTDLFDRIGYVKDAESTGDKYAYIANVYDNDEGTLTIRLYTQDGEVVEAKAASNIKLWGPQQTSEATDSTRKSELERLKQDSSYIKIGGYPVKLCKYRINTKGEISKLYCAVSVNDVDESTDALRVYPSSLSGTSGSGGTIAGYSLKSGLYQFSVPMDSSDRAAASGYSISTGSTSEYTNYDGGSSATYTIGDFKTKTAQVLLRFDTSSNQAKDITDLDTASIASTLAISEINEAVDGDGNSILNLVGYSSGAEMNIDTMKNTAVYEYTGWDTTARKYEGDLIFDATSDSIATFSNVVHAGDIFDYTTDNGNASVLVKVIDIEQLAKAAISGSTDDMLMSAPSGTSASGATRDTHYIGIISSCDVDDMAYIGLTSDVTNPDVGSVTYDTSASFTLVEVKIDEDGNVLSTDLENDPIDPSEIIPYESGEDTFDFGFFKSLKGNFGVGYIVRVTIDR